MLLLWDTIAQPCSATKQCYGKEAYNRTWREIRVIALLSASNIDLMLAEFLILCYRTSEVSSLGVIVFLNVCKSTKKYHPRSQQTCCVNSWEFNEWIIHNNQLLVAGASLGANSTPTLAYQTDEVSAPPVSSVDNTAPLLFPCSSFGLFYHLFYTTDRLNVFLNLHIFPRRLCKTRILTSSSSAMVWCDCRCSLGTFNDVLSYPFMNASRRASPYQIVTRWTHAHFSSEVWEKNVSVP